MDERTKKAFDFTAESSKQMTTLATGIIALSVVFIDKVIGEGDVDMRMLQWAWLCFVGTVVFGLWMSLSLAGTLGSKTVSDAQLTTYKPNMQLPMVLQIVSFVAGIVLTVLFGWHAL